MQVKPTIRKQPADSVRYGWDISTRGGAVFCAYDGERLVVVAASAREARHKYSEAYMAFQHGRKDGCGCEMTPAHRASQKDPA